MPNQPAYPAAVAELAAQIPAAVVVSPEELAFFHSSITAPDALAEGTRIESVTVLDEVLRVGALAVESAVANKVTGYGPLRMRYFTDLAGSLAAKVTQLDTSRVQASGAGTARDASLVSTRTLRLQAIRVLKNLAGRRPEAKSRLKTAREGAEKADERVRSLEALAKELEEQIAKVPAGIAADAGATPVLVDALKVASGGVLGSKGSAQDARGTIASLYDEMNELDGRLMHELRLLVGALRDSRKTDNSIPAMKSPLLKSGNRKKATSAAPPGGGATPG